MMKKVLAVLLVCLICASMTAFYGSAEIGEQSATVVNAMYGTPIIDGDIDSVWDTAEVQRYGRDKNNPASTFQAGEFRVLWDENYIYILFEINDTTLMPDDLARKDSNWYKRDMIAVTFNPSGSHEETDEIMPPAFWYGYRPCGVMPNFQKVPANVFFTEQEDAYASGSTDFVKYPADQRMARFKYTDTGYLVECKINLTARDPSFTLGTGKTVSFDTWVYGNDYTATNTAANADHVYPWADLNAASYKDDSAKGGMLFLAGPGGGPTTAAATTSAPESSSAPVTSGAIPEETTDPDHPLAPDTGNAGVAVILTLAVFAGIIGIALTVSKLTEEK